MKKIILSISMLLLIVVANLVSINYASAQDNVKHYIRLAEMSNNDISIVSKGLLKMNPSFVKASNGVILGRNAYTSESGLTYTFTAFDDLGKFMQENGDYWNAASAENPGVMEAINATIIAPNVQSIWIKLNNASNSTANYIPSEYIFRRLSIVNVVIGKSKEYEELLVKLKGLMSKYGFELNKNIFKSVTGYNSSSYLTISSDRSLIEYMNSRSERMKKISETPEFVQVTDAMRAITIPVKVDFLSRIK